ncbi:hypothetical protein JCM19046_4613 [Bacillus sp. JCM 19046]|nr:hypothetical protein JCM19045_4815 [Bacillus sp. JCM 19045]GAF19919.1 hypothetical protein JCM19046_4613 [Bacillus sp. JCM 19046]
MNQEIRDARVKEILVANGLILLVASLVIALVYLQVNLSYILVALVIVLAVTSIRRIWFTKTPISLFQWQKVLVAHERFQFGEKDWANRVNFDAWSKIVFCGVILFVAWQPTENIWVMNQGFLTFVLIATAVFVLITNYSVISKGRTIDTLNGEQESGIQFKGLTLKRLLGVWITWLLIFVVAAFLVFR